MYENFIIICRADRKLDGSPGDYVLVTRTIFPEREPAEQFAAECASHRDSIVVSGRFTELRQDFDERFGKQYGRQP
jgi:hypothetical protein